MTVDSARDARPHVVIVGGGFGGLSCAKALSRSGAVRITVIDRNNFHTFLPLLYQVATSGLNAGDVAYPLRGVLRRYDGVELRMGAVGRVNLDERTVEVEGETIAYDHLVIAAGSQAQYFGVPGAAEHAFSLYSLADAVRLRNHVLRRFEAAAADAALIEAGALDIVVIGGGPTGVETAGAFAELDTHVLEKDFPHMDVKRATVTLVEQSDSVLGAFSERSQRHALDELRAKGVGVRLGTTVAEVRPDGVRLGDGAELRAQTVVWAAGVRAAEGAATLGVEGDDEPAVDHGVPHGVQHDAAGRIVVNADLSVPGQERLWAIGDAAQIPDSRSRSGAFLPQLAQPAIQSGVHAARGVVATVLGDEPVAMRYRDKGIMATIGRRAAVAELPVGVKLRGGIAWVAWLGLHLVTLLGMRNRASVLASWAWNYLTWDRGSRLIIEPDSGTTDDPDGNAAGRPAGVADPVD